MMIANISPSNTNFEETLSTLKYAHTTKSVNNKPTMNIENDPKDQLIRELQNEIKNLRHRLDYRALDSAWLFCSCQINVQTNTVINFDALNVVSVYIPTLLK